jgi:hypothetical protein
MRRSTILATLRMNAISHSGENALSQLRECIITRFHDVLVQPFCGFAELLGFGSIMIHRRRQSSSIFAAIAQGAALST